MAPDTVARAAQTADGEVMASVEGGAEQTFIIADVSTDGAYCTVPLDQAASLPAWR